MIKNLFGRNRPGRDTPAADESQGTPIPLSTEGPGRDPGAGGLPTFEATDAPASLLRSGESPAGPPISPPAPSFEQIASLAYEIWLSKGMPEGSEREDWAEAERRLLEP